METTFKFIPLFLATIMAGLTAGLCFTWGNAVTPGIGKLDDLAYLKAFQQMNRVIINPLFLIIFFSPFLVTLGSAFIHRKESGFLFIGLLAAAILYFVGLVLVTILGNVPLNEVLNNTDLSTINETDATQLRQHFEQPWNFYHTIRTWAAGLSFCMLVFACIYIKLN